MAPCSIHSGSGTVSKVAKQLGRHSIYIDRHEPYVQEGRSPAIAMRVPPTTIRRQFKQQLTDRNAWDAALRAGVPPICMTWISRGGQGAGEGIRLSLSHIIPFLRRQETP